ncbi:MAG TPA: hypothetical protein VLH77_00035 [Gammaproteobacteria bacterium]|nr:hypothetical protein [Gammaproteobacteria bacterium]
MNEQTVQSQVQWIVIDDSIGDGNPSKTAEILKTLTNPNIKAELYGGPRMWRPGVNTQRGNLELALSFVKGDKIFIWEDDDAYHPAYLQVNSALLDLVDMVGESNSKYYYLQGPGGKEHSNYLHSSLCQTGFVKRLLPMFSAAVNSGQMYIDLEFWSKAREKHIPRLLITERNLCIGIKGMPGRENLGGLAKQKDYLIDPNLAKLKEWIGEEAAEVYRPFIRKVYESSPKKSNEIGYGRRQGRDNQKWGKIPPRIPVSSTINSQKGGSLQGPGGGYIGSELPQSVSQSQSQKPKA